MEESVQTESTRLHAGKFREILNEKTCIACLNLLRSSGHGTPTIVPKSRTNGVHVMLKGMQSNLSIDISPLFSRSSRSLLSSLRLISVIDSGLRGDQILLAQIRQIISINSLRIPPLLSFLFSFPFDLSYKCCFLSFVMIAALVGILDRHVQSTLMNAPQRRVRTEEHALIWSTVIDALVCRVRSTSHTDDRVLGHKLDSWVKKLLGIDKIGLLVGIHT